MALFFLGSLAAIVHAAPTPAPADVTALKQQNAQAQAENELITQELAAVAAKDWPKAEEAAQRLVAADPANWQYRQALADARFAQGKYTEALADYAAALVGAEKAKVSPSLRNAMAVMYMDEGAAYVKLKRTDDAVVAYRKAVPLAANPATAWFNLCALDYNLANTDAALADCTHAITADPKKADAYFIKGSLMFGNATTDAAGKVIVPPGTLETLREYLKLAPNGAHAGDVKQMLEYAGASAAP